MTERKRDAQEDLRYRALRLLEGNPELSQWDLAKALGISVGGTWYVINALVEKGLVKLGNFRTAKDRRRYAYILTPKGVAEKVSMTGRFLDRKKREYEALRREIALLQQELSDEVEKRDSEQMRR